MQEIVARCVIADKESVLNNTFNNISFSTGCTENAKTFLKRFFGYALQKQTLL